MLSRARLSLWSERLRSSLWAIPMSMVAASIALVIATLALDRTVGADLPGGWWGFGVGAEGTRLTLSTIAGSVMTVTGVAFSTTIVVLQLASTQYSPRVIRAFRRDRTIQAVLGLLSATFVYCLLVLRSIVAPDEGPAFTAPISVSVATLLGIASLLALVTMVHHVAENVRVAAILRNIADETRDAIERAWPEPLGDDAGALRETSPPAAGDGPSRCCRAAEDGYVEYVDATTVDALAGARLVRIEVMVGDYVRRGDALATVWPADASFDDRTLVRAFALASERTITQDVRYGVRLVVDVALRALSPGIQDPRTAVECVDVLGALLLHAAGRRPPDPVRRTAHAIVIAPRPDLEDLVALAFDEIVSSADRSVPVHRAVIAALAAIARGRPSPAATAAVARARSRILEELRAARLLEADRGALTTALAALLPGS